MGILSFTVDFLIAHDCIDLFFNVNQAFPDVCWVAP
ncbi:hypothetical protein AGR8A_Lc10306 [Agrobacterium fabrum str. J-07]|nr:hypothetical protein AGR8A_Lc10306 [Agrobacterium fabrum str. J-07]